MVDLKKHNEDEPTETSSGFDDLYRRDYIDMTWFKVFILIVLSAILACAGIKGLQMLIPAVQEFNDSYVSEAVVPVADETFHLTVTGKNRNTVTGKFIMEFSDEKGAGRSFFVSEEMFGEYEIGNQIDVTADYNAGAFRVGNEKIREVE